MFVAVYEALPETGNLAVVSSLRTAGYSYYCFCFNRPSREQSGRLEGAKRRHFFFFLDIM